ncbi:peptidylprolyl isomerase [Desulfosarcina ovata subsp. sediminis]|uniref:Periplasmic chaperone PpiD n=2 Tax=Desulfosarcina ovata TaxID=83564 RepID=A0A5K7ZKH3_9BACT|nr:peptidylprolyl isomerase [Desulfosarcina ovata subsp. sediminis]
MLNVMRKHAGSWMIKIILFAIVIVFSFWGVGSFRSRQASKVATVNDEIIGVTEYQRAYNNLIEQYRRQFGSSLNDGMLEMLRIKQQTLEQLINRTILLQEAKKLGLRVSDEEVADSIVRLPVFQSNGTFDNRRYRALLSQIHLTPEEFEADQKNALLSEKLSRIITGAAKVSAVEAREWYDWRDTTVNVDYVLFRPNDYTDITPSAEAVADYFEAQKENYKTDPLVKARYVVFDPDAYKKQVSVTEDEIADYYDTHIDEFKNEKKVEARHILIKVDPNADQATDQEAKARAEAVAQKARSGEDFAKLAEAFSEGPTKSQGGYLGKFTQAQMVKPFADKAFSMAAGEISDPVKTQFGWHVIKVESVEPAATQTLEQARAQIVKTLTDTKAKTLAYDNAEQFYENTFGKEDLVKNAKTFDLVVLETGAFSRRGPEALGRDREAFAKIAFGLGVDEISDIQEIGGRYYLIQTTETIAARIPELETVNARVTADLKKKMQSDKALESATAMAVEIEGGKAFADSAAGRNLTVNQTGLFKRDASIPGIGSDPAFTQAAFALTPDNATGTEPIEGHAGVYLLHLAERKAPPSDGFDNEKEKISDLLLRQKQQTVLQDWMTARRAESQVTVEKGYTE